MKNDTHYMKIALKQAIQSTLISEVPVGAILVNDQKVIAKAHNQTITQADPTAHAEILAIRSAGKKLNNYRLPDLTLYVTIEPCIMCMGALIHARIKRIVFGAHDSKWGGCGSIYSIHNDNRLNHHIQITGGVCERECRELIQHFFQQKRKNNG